VADGKGWRPGGGGDTLAAMIEKEAPMRLAALAAAGLMLWGCTPKGPPAPSEPGVCWRAVGTAEAPKFEPIENGVENIETCATRLEALRLMGQGRVVNGAYEGRFIFVDDEEISWADNAAGDRRLPIFSYEKRRDVDAGLQQLIEQQKAAPKKP
jgi:hypothetical protein